MFADQEFECQCRGWQCDNHSGCSNINLKACGRYSCIIALGRGHSRCICCAGSGVRRLGNCRNDSAEREELAITGGEMQVEGLHSGRRDCSPEI